MAKGSGRLLAGLGLGRRVLFGVDDLPLEVVDRKLGAFSGFLPLSHMAADTVGREESRCFFGHLLLIEVADETLGMAGPALLDSGGKLDLGDSDLFLISRVARGALKMILFLE